MSVKKTLSPEPFNTPNSASLKTSTENAPSIATSSSSKNENGQSKSVGEASSRSQQEEFNQMMADYKRDADKDKFVVLPPTPRIKEILKRDPLAVWKAIYKM